MARTSPLGVFLNGSRTYVQGTQILARSAEAVFEDGSGLLRQATFHSITDRLVTLTPADQAADLPAAPLGRAVYEDAQGNALSVVWHAQDGAAPRADRPLSCTWRRQDQGQAHPLSARFALAGLTSGEDYLNALIQAIKGLHDALAEDVHDIWFTGLRRADIPMGPFPASSGTLTITGDRLMGRDGAFQSIQRTCFEDGTGLSINGVVTFAFKSKGFSYVD